MKEMLLVGRGGDGVVLASQVLADTFARAGFFVQTFPEFKAERRGAPISASLRWDDAPIRRRYKVLACDVLVSISPSPPSPQQLAAVRPGGLVLLNRETRFPGARGLVVARVPASRIAEENGILSPEGRPLGNVAVLGACVRLLLPTGLTVLEKALSARLRAASVSNVAAARAGYERCTKQHVLADDARLAPLPSAAEWKPPLYPVSTTTSLGNRTGSWSLDRPVLLEGCNHCALCALFCPEGAIARTDGEMVLDYLYCKGCGICEVVCPVRNAIAMEEVPA